MKFAKILSLATIALSALMAMAGAASATTLTSPSGTTFTGTVKALSTNVKLTSPFGGFGTVECEESTVEGTVKTHGPSSTVTGSISKLTFTICKGGEPTDPVATPGSLELHSGGSNTGTLTSLGASVIVHNTALGTCTFSTAAGGTLIGTVTGSSSSNTRAIVNLTGVIPATSGFCGQGTLEGTYTVTSPVPLLID